MIALPEDYFVSYIVSDLVKGKEVKFYHTIEECFNAVNKGKTDVTFADQNAASYYLSMQKYTNLYVAGDSGMDQPLSFGVYIDTDTPLLSILDKSLLCIGQDEINRIVVKYSAADEQFSLEGLYYSNPQLLIGIVVVLCIMFFVIIYLRTKAVNAIKQGEQEKTLARFMGYVCASNESVLEVDLQNEVAQSYELNREGNVNIHTFSYRNVNYDNTDEVIYPDDFKNIVSGISEEMIKEMIDENGEQKYYEFRSRSEDGSYKWYSYSIQAIPKDKEHPRNFILFKKNIDKLKREEERKKKALEDALLSARAASRAKGNFLSKMSHEIRTPLNAVIGYLSIAEDTKGDEEKIQHCIENGGIAAKHLLQIINDVLDMSSIESGRLKIANEVFDLKKEISDITTIFYQNAKEKNVHFVTKINDLIEEKVMGDQLRLNQVLMNLLSNAVKFTPAGGTIDLILKQLNPQTETDEVFLQFQVADTGIGMSEDYMSRLFLPFEQESASTAQQYGGSGLGLSITKNLVDLMGGTIDVESHQKEGTTFTVTLHFGRVRGEEAVKVDQKAYAHVRTLIIDEEKEEGSYIRSMLKRCGVKADVVTDGDTAIKRIKSRMGGDYTYDLCIIDWSRPEFDGAALTNQIQSEFGEKIPVVVAAYDVEVCEEQAKNSEIKQFISKPLFQSTLFDLLVSTFGAYDIEQTDQRKSEKVSMKGLKVLLAEDNEMNMEIAMTVLKKAEIVVEPAGNGQEAVEKFLEAPADTYDLILMDIQMPVLNGYEATQKIRSSAHPRAKTIPIIAMTANAFAEDVAEALASGMNAHIAKPVNYEKMFSVLKQFSRTDSK